MNEMIFNNNHIILKEDKMRKANSAFQPSFKKK